MAKSFEEKLVIGFGALGLLILGVRAIRLVLTGAVLARQKSAKCGADDQAT